MSLYEAYLEEIVERKKIGLSPKPIYSGDFMNEIFADYTEEKIN